MEEARVSFAEINSAPDRMEKLVVELSMPHYSKVNALPTVESPVGLPINALPGWESIPLHSKLPMLKCPDNQVIFSKNKIGRHFESCVRDFDSVCLNEKMDYNPLHDPHLRRFYSNEKLLKRLRDNGEITQNNDVICTLKEFNEYRIPLHETYLSLMRMERSRLMDEKRDQQMIQHAENVAEREKRTMGLKKGDVLERKAELGRKRDLWIQSLRLRAQRKVLQLESMKVIREMVLRRKKELHDFRIQHRLNVTLDLQRKRLIALKKHLQFKSDRLKRNTKFIHENAKAQTKEKARQSWEMHLKERLIKHEHLKRSIKENERSINEWIENHIAEYQKKWQVIQMELDLRSGHRAKAHKQHLQMHPHHKHKKHKGHEKSKTTQEKSDEDGLKDLTTEEMRDALHAVLDLEDPELTHHYDEGNYIYKAAKYILDDILAKFDKDLSDDTHIQAVLEHRISRLFTEVKQYVVKRAAQVISTGGLTKTRSCNDQKRLSILSKGTTRKYSLSKFVAFDSYSALIGKGSYALSNDIKLTSERLPTPAGSLTSVPIQFVEEDSNKAKRLNLEKLKRNEQIFIEHLFIKFKRQLLVGIGRQVLAAIECHRHDKILDVRRELQDIDKEFLVKTMARSILSYAINNCNYHSNSLLCQYALAGDIVLSLQKTLLIPERDPRIITTPHSRCTCRIPVPFASHCK